MFLVVPTRQHDRPVRWGPTVVKRPLLPTITILGGAHLVGLIDCSTIISFTDHQT